MLYLLLALLSANPTGASSTNQTLFNADGAVRPGNVPTASLRATCINGEIVYDSTTHTEKQCYGNVWTSINGGSYTLPALQAGVLGGAMGCTGAGCSGSPGLTCNAGYHTSGFNSSGIMQCSADSAPSYPITYDKGGTGQTTAPDDDLLLGNGSGWQLAALANCPTGGISYTAATNTFGCNSITGYTLPALQAGVLGGAMGCTGASCISSPGLTCNTGYHAMGFNVSGIMQCSADPTVPSLPLSIANGGTANGSLAVTNGNICYMNGSAVSSAAGTNGQAVTWNSSGAPGSAAIPSVPISIANGGTANGSLPVTNGNLAYTDGTKLNSAAGTNGALVTWNTSGAPGSLATVPIAKGGTNNGSLPVTNGNICYMNGSAVSSAAGTNGQAVTWNTSGAPGSAAIPSLPISIANGGTANGSLAVTNGNICYMNGSAVSSAAGTNGQAVTWNSSGAPGSVALPGVITATTLGLVKGTAGSSLACASGNEAVGFNTSGNLLCDDALAYLVANAPLTGTGRAADHLILPAATGAADGYLSHSAQTIGGSKTLQDSPLVLGAPSGTFVVQGAPGSSGASTIGANAKYLAGAGSDSGGSANSAMGGWEWIGGGKGGDGSGTYAGSQGGYLQIMSGAGGAGTANAVSGAGSNLNILAGSAGTNSKNATCSLGGDLDFEAGAASAVGTSIAHGSGCHHGRIYVGNASDTDSVNIPVDTYHTGNVYVGSGGTPVSQIIMTSVLMSSYFASSIAQGACADASSPPPFTGLNATSIVSCSGNLGFTGLIVYCYASSAGYVNIRVCNVGSATARIPGNTLYLAAIN